MARGGKRQGAGRKPGVTIPTYVVRIGTDIPKELINNIPQLRDLIGHWEDECLAAGENSACHHFLKQCLTEIRSLGF